jgi:hypothetical protein
MRVSLTCLSAALCALLVPVAAPAQEVASTLDQLRVLLRPGDTVRVTDDAGQEFRATILELSSTSLALLRSGQRRDLTVDGIQRITRSQHGDLAAGAKWGFGTGAGFGVLMTALAISSYDGRCNGCAPYVIAAGAVYGGIGAGIGVAIAAASTHQQLVFNKAGTPLKLTMAPLLSRERQGVLVSLRF